MRLYSEILKGLSGDEDVSANVRVTLLFGRGGYFQGVKSVNEFSPDKLVLILKNAVLEVVGENFVVEKYVDGDLEVSGKISEIKLL